MKVLNSIDELLEKLPSFSLLQSFLLEDELKQLSFRNILHDQEKLFRGFYDFVELNDVGMTNLLQYVNLSGDSFDICHIVYFAFLQDLHCNFFPGHRVNA